ncbi:MAG TPA: RND transporter, partial [Woeseiaceae bacterium]
MKQAVIRFGTERPKTVYALVLLLVIVLGAMMMRLEIDTDPENMLPDTQSDRLFHNAVEDRFTLHDAIVVGIVNNDHADGIFNPGSLAALHSLSQSILELDGVIAPDLMSLAGSDNITQEGPGTIRFEWMMKSAPVTEQQALDIKAKVARLPLLNDTLVSGDGRAAAIYVPITS